VVTYCAPADIRNALSGTDSGSGTAAQLNDTQLTQSCQLGSDRVSAYAGTVYDSSSPQAVPPPLVTDLAIGLACYYATLTYLKGKPLAPDDPVRLRYIDAVGVLNDVRDGKVRIDPEPPGSIAEAGAVINRIPRVFTGDDSNTYRDPMTGTIEPRSVNESLLGGWGADYA
jgi:phage gp36-like protein